MSDQEPGRVEANVEPCDSCGEDTAVGSPLFFDRHTIERPDGSRSFLCSLCVAESRKRRPSRMDASDQDTIASNALGHALNSMQLH